MVMCNTSPLNYLVQIGATDLLPRVHGEIHIPELVVTELCDTAAPAVVRKWVMSPPDWLKIHPNPIVVPKTLNHLHAGEAAAITLGLEKGAELLLIDDLDGRIAARDAGLQVMGTLGFLDAAATRGLGTFDTLLDDLMRTNFRAPRDLVEALRARHRR